MRLSTVLCSNTRSRSGVFYRGTNFNPAHGRGDFKLPSCIISSDGPSCACDEVRGSWPGKALPNQCLSTHRLPTFWRCRECWCDENSNLPSVPVLFCPRLNLNHRVLCSSLVSPLQDRTRVCYPNCDHLPTTKPIASRQSPRLTHLC